MRHWQAAAFGVWLLLLAWAAVLLVPPLARGGLKPCARLDARLCVDLGPEECAVWTGLLGRRGAASTMPHHARYARTARIEGALHGFLGWDDSRADNPRCYDELAAYPHVLARIRAAVAEQRKLTDDP
jgi:hypothetical protein